MYVAILFFCREIFICQTAHGHDGRVVMACGLRTLLGTSKEDSLVANREMLDKKEHVISFENPEIPQGSAALGTTRSA